MPDSESSAVQVVVQAIMNRLKIVMGSLIVMLSQISGISFPKAVNYACDIFLVVRAVHQLCKAQSSLPTLFFTGNPPGHGGAD